MSDIANRKETEYGADPPETMDDHSVPTGGPQVKFENSLISPKIVCGSVALLDSIFIVLSSTLALFLYIDENFWELTKSYSVIIVIFGIIGPLIFHFTGLYSIQKLRQFLPQFVRLLCCWTLLFVLILIIFFFAKISEDFSRAWIVISFVSGFTVLVVWRNIVAIQLRTWTKDGKIGRRAIIFGGGKLGKELVERLDKCDTTDIRICGVFDDRQEDRTPESLIHYPKLGNIDELIRFTREHRIDILIVTLPITAEKRLLQILKKLWILPIDIRLSAHSSSLKFRPRTYSYIGNVPFLDVSDVPIADWNYMYKWLFDKIVALISMIILSPLMLLIAIAVKLDSKGPVFFRQHRYGFNNELIEIYKFRSMFQDQSDKDAVRLVTRDDERITRVGRILRKLSLDELPQLLNVLEGSISLVGPRPHALEAKAENKLYQNVVDGYFARHRVKPGITGWAQIHGFRGETDTRDKIQNRVDYDLHYIENWSVLLTVYILLLTPLALLNTENAY